MPASGVTDAARNEQASGMTAGRHSVDRIVRDFILLKMIDCRVALFSQNLKSIPLPKCGIANKSVGNGGIIAGFILGSALRNEQGFQTQEKASSQKIYFAEWTWSQMERSMRNPRFLPKEYSPRSGLGCKSRMGSNARPDLIELPWE
jgi:hypothetical protein